jgi:isoleucyl-tRNA synthetase
MAQRLKDGGWQVEQVFRSEVAELWIDHEETGIKMHCSQSRYRDAITDGNDEMAIDEWHKGIECIDAHLKARERMQKRLLEIIGVSFDSGAMVNMTEGIVYQQAASRNPTPGNRPLIMPNGGHL